MGIDWEIQWWLREANGVFMLGLERKCNVFYVSVFLSLMFATHVKRQWYLFVLLLWWWSSLNYAKAFAHDIICQQTQTPNPICVPFLTSFPTQPNMQFLHTLQLPCYIFNSSSLSFFLFKPLHCFFNQISSRNRYPFSISIVDKDPNQLLKKGVRWYLFCFILSKHISFERMM